MRRYVDAGVLIQLVAGVLIGAVLAFLLGKSLIGGLLMFLGFAVALPVVYLLDRGPLWQRIEEGVLTFIFAAMTLVTFLQVILRYVFNSGFVWALEFTTYCFAWLVLFGVSYVFKRQAHIGVDAFAKLFRMPVQRVLGLVVVAFCLLYAGIMLYGSWDYVYKIWRIGIPSEDLPIPQWVPVSILIVGMALLAVRLLEAGHAIARGEALSLLGDEAREAIQDFAAAEVDPDAMATPEETRAGIPHPPGPHDAPPRSGRI
ncbi:MAG: TRAP transporter small permease [Geminicoccaceae bacterium]|nr:TRAP transporter small permease [Geminicoccaceae bacterium]